MDKIKQIDEMWNNLPRSFKRRFERELDQIKQAPGLGKGWRLTAPSLYFYEKYNIPISKLRTYPVEESTKSTDITKLELESIRIQEKYNIVVPLKD